MKFPYFVQLNRSELWTSVLVAQVINIFPIIRSNSDFEKSAFHMTSTENEDNLQFRHEEP